LRSRAAAALLPVSPPRPLPVCPGVVQSGGWAATPVGPARRAMGATSDDRGGRGPMVCSSWTGLLAGPPSLHQLRHELSRVVGSCPDDPAGSDVSLLPGACYPFSEPSVRPLMK